VERSNVYDVLSYAMNPADKIKNLDELRAIMRKMHSAGKTVVFANGCFDLIHVGHIRYLQSAREMGDALIVGINGDTGVEALKGKGRPLQSGQDRAEMIASMECVDYVLLFDTFTVDGILSELQPDIHAKGTDYSEESVPERNTVRSYGGKVAIAGDPKDHSTRDLIQTIVSKFSS
jgi:rfaE bifunctional protein nucleotidyltransferase chain/domain